MENWLVLANCQSLGLANCLQLQHLNVNVVAIEEAAFQAEKSRIHHELARSNKIFISEPYKSLVDTTNLAAVNIPQFTFSGYHPDIIYLECNGQIVSSPMGTYHSTICFVAHKKGYSIRDTRALFSYKYYERFGYFDRWENEYEQLDNYLDFFGIDFAPLFRRWTMKQAFMWSNNHPRIDCLFDIAAEVLHNSGIDPIETQLRPHDNLLNGPVYPIYNELAEALGIKGSYLFKPILKYTFLTLDQFIRASFDIYDKQEMNSIVPLSLFEEQYETVFNNLP